MAKTGIFIELEKHWMWLAVFGGLVVLWWWRNRAEFGIQLPGKIGAGSKIKLPPVSPSPAPGLDVPW